MSEPAHSRSPELITSVANPTVKLARSLHRRRMRYRERALLLEGPRVIQTAVANGAKLRALIVDAARLDVVDRSLLEEMSSAADRVVQVNPELFSTIADTEQPQPLVAVAHLPSLPVPNDCSLVLAIDGLRDPGNLGTLIRSAAASGADAVALLPGTVDYTNPKVVRASAGALYAIPIVHVDDVAELQSRAFVQQPRVILADAAGETRYDEFDWRPDAILVLGSEASGARDQSRTYATDTVSIPMTPGVESLNAAVSGSILLFTASSQRRRH